MHTPRPGALRETLAANLRRLRAAMGHSQDAFADLCGLDRSYMGGLERSERNVGIDNLEKIAAAVRMEPWQLLKPRSGKE